MITNLKIPPFHIFPLLLKTKGIDRTVLEGSEYHMCASKVMLLIYFSFSSFLWTAAMSHSSYVTVKNLFLTLTVQTTRRASMRRALCQQAPHPPIMG